MHWRRLFAATAAAAVLVVSVHGAALAHAALRSSDPGAGSALQSPPTRIRLEFTETVEASLCTIALVGPDGRRTQLAIQRDSSDARAISGVVSAAAATAVGRYRVLWRAIAADGHPSSGSFTFEVAGEAAPPASTTPSRSAVAPPSDTTSSLASDSALSALSGSVGPTVAGAPLFASVVRGVGLTALMVLAGMLLFLAWGHSADAQRPRTVILWAALIAVVFLAAHVVLWLLDTAPDHRLTSAWLTNAFTTAPAKLEVARVALALLVLIAFGLAHRIGTSLLLAMLALAVSGAIGHSAAIEPELAIPAKIVHLVFAGVWAGGLTWLITRERDNVEAYAAEAARISSAALLSVILIVASGVGQAMLFMDTPRDLLHTAYGVILLLKVAGLLVLVAFGARHRGQVAHMRGTPAVEELSASVSREIVVLIVVALLGALLAYVPPHHVMTTAAATSGLFPHWIQR